MASWIIGDEICAEVIETSALLEAVGIRGAHYDGQFLVKGNQIKSVQLEPKPETREATDMALYRLISWTSKERPKRLA